MKQNAPSPPTLTSINRLCFVIAKKEMFCMRSIIIIIHLMAFSLIYDFEPFYCVLVKRKVFDRGKKFDKLMTVSSVAPNHN